MSEGLPASALAPKHLRILRLCVVGLIAAVYLISLCPHWLPGADSALYRLLGRSLAAGEGYTLFGRPSAFVPPGFPAMLAVAETLGLRAPIAQNAVMMALAGCAALVAYLVMRQRLAPELALSAVLLFALSNHTHDASMQLLSDVPSVLLVALGLWLLIRWSRTGRGVPELGALALVAAGWVRLPAIPLGIGAAVGLAVVNELRWRRARAGGRGARASRLRGRLNALGLLAGLGASLAVFYAHYKAVSAATEVSSYMHHIDALAGRGIPDALANLAGNFYYTGETLSRLFTSQRLPAWGSMVVFGVPILLGMAVCLRRGQWIGPAASACYLGAVMLFRVPIARYLLPVAFLLILYYAVGCITLLGRIRRLRPVATIAVAILLAALAACSLPRDIRRIYWAHHADFPAVYRHGRTELYDAGRWLKANAGPGDLFVSSTNSYALALLGELDALPVPKRFLRQAQLPGDLFALLDGEGVTLLIFHPDDEPGEYEQLRREALGRKRLQLLHRNGKYEIYRYVRAATTTGAASGG